MNYSWERILKPDGTIDTEQLKENFKQIEQDKRNSPYLYGSGNPFTNTSALIGSIYVDTTNGKVYKRRDTTSVNSGWVELLQRNNGQIIDNTPTQYNFPTTLGTLSPLYHKWVLPYAGSFLLSASFCLAKNNTVGGLSYCVLNDSTTGLNIPNTYRFIFEQWAGDFNNTDFGYENSWLITVDKPKTIFLCFFTSVAGLYSIFNQGGQRESCFRWIEL